MVGSERNEESYHFFDEIKRAHAKCSEVCDGERACGE
jgi:hypothetical protein